MASKVNSGKSASVVLVGGAEGNLGQEAVEHFSRTGLKVVAACRNADAAAMVADKVKRLALPGVHVLAADLADDQQVARLVADAERLAGPVEAVFNAAGGFRYGAVAAMPVADAEFLLMANFRTSWLLARHCVPRCVERGFGRLVFVSAKTTLSDGEAGLGLYAASKAALNAMVKGLAADLKHTGVTVNALLPTTLDTPANRVAMPAANFDEWIKPSALLDMAQQLFGPAGRAANGALISLPG